MCCLVALTDCCIGFNDVERSASECCLVVSSQIAV